MEKYIFYSVIGRHAGETVAEILERKQDEVTAAGFSLWSAQIDAKSMEQLADLTENDIVTVYCKISSKALDPVPNNQVCQAHRMILINGQEKEIPAGIRTTYNRKKSKYQAYVVGNYQFLEEPQIVDFGQYETTLADGSKKSYSERFNLKQFQNTLGVFTPDLKETCSKEIYAKMELVYPFVVTID